jgi:putative ABC transport system permease protein
MLRQTLAVTAMGLRGLPSRLGNSLVIVTGIAGVVAVLVSVLAMSTGFRKTVANTGADDRAIVLRGGSNAELSSALAREQAQTIMEAAQVRRDSEGRPLASAEAVVIVNLPTRADGADANVTLRGVGGQGLAMRPEIRLVEGRLFQPAVREVMVGRSALAQFDGLSLGSQVDFRDSAWTVVGVFESDGDARESELIGDNETVLSAYRRNGFQSVTVQLDDAAGFDAFKAALTTDPTLSVDVQRERDYYAEQSQQLTQLLDFLAVFVGGIMAVGAMFGALNTLYSAVSARSLEIATLRAIGFSAGPVVVSVMVEALLLALIGGVLGALLAALLFNGNVVNTLGSNFSQVVFQLDVSPALVQLGVIWALVIGALGGLLPALRAARLPVVTALRATG